MELKLKVCGMRDPENILEVASLRPAYMGFIFYRHSKRVVAPDFEIPADLSRKIKRVGVFVNEQPAEILNRVRMHSLDFVQLHGEEPPEHCEVLRKAGAGVIKVFSVGNEIDFRNLKPYQKQVDFFLFDTKSDGYGGSGRRFDWKLLTDYNQEVPFFLSGGLSPNNIEDVEAIRGMNLHALDVNSGVENSPGIKNVELVRRVADRLEGSKIEKLKN